MKGLTSKEEEIMNYFWHKGPLFVKELLDFYDEPTERSNGLGDNDKRKSVAVGIFFPAPNQSQKFYNCADISGDKV